jgi:Ca2+-transporting ATPase
VIEGRGIGISMKRLILFLVGTGMSEIVLILSSFIIGIPLPLLPIQLLWLNIATGAVQDFALAQEPKETTLHRNTLTHPSHPLIDRDITISLLTISLSIGITGLIFSKILIEQNLTPANFLITYFVFVMNILLLSVRAETPLWKNIFLKSKWIPITIILVMAIHFFIISSEIGSRILLTERVSISLIISMVILTVLSLTPYEIYKKYRKSQNI